MCGSLDPPQSSTQTASRSTFAKFDVGNLSTWVQSTIFGHIFPKVGWVGSAKTDKPIEMPFRGLTLADDAGSRNNVLVR